MQDLDQQLLKEFRRQEQDIGSGAFKDPSTPYQVSIEPSKAGHLITVIDTRKRWFGRIVHKYEHPLDRHSSIIDNGPVAVVIMVLEMVIEKRLPLG